MQLVCNFANLTELLSCLMNNVEQQQSRWVSPNTWGWTGAFRLEMEWSDLISCFWCRRAWVYHPRMPFPDFLWADIGQVVVRLWLKEDGMTAEDECHPLWQTHCKSLCPTFHQVFYVPNPSHPKVRFSFAGLLEHEQRYSAGQNAQSRD